MGVATVERAHVHYLLRLMLGAIFGISVAHLEVLRVDTAKQGVLLGVAYVEVVSQPILALSPILLKGGMTETVVWFGASAAMHFLWGVDRENPLVVVVQRRIAPTGEDRDAPAVDVLDAARFRH